jgi:hypothetical protein
MRRSHFPLAQTAAAGDVVSEALLEQGVVPWHRHEGISRLAVAPAGLIESL